MTGRRSLFATLVAGVLCLGLAACSSDSTAATASTDTSTGADASTGTGDATTGSSDGSTATSDAHTGASEVASSKCNVAPTLASLSAEYFGGSCTFGKCHAPPKPAGGLDLTPSADYAQLVNVSAHHPQAKGAILVVPGQPEQSFLYQKVHGPVPAGGLMPPGETEPYDADCSVAMLRQWILDGAKP